MKKLIKIITIIFLSLSSCFINVYAADWEEVKCNVSESGNIYEGWDVKVHSDNKIEVRMKTRTTNSSAKDAWTEYDWTYKLSKDSTTVDRMVVELGGCNKWSDTNWHYSGTASTSWIPDNGNMAGTYVIKGTPGEDNGCTLKARSSGIYSLNLTSKLNLSYTISYDGNGATSGSTASQTVSSGSGAYLRANGFTKTGYIY